MKAAIAFEFSERDRQAVARFLGRDGLASHIECVAWAREQLRGSLTLMARVAERPPLPATRTRREGDPA
jgi:hypothetical protein